MGATEAEREAAAGTVAAILVGIGIETIVEISIVVVDEHALAQDLRMMTDTTDPVVADLDVTKIALVRGTAAVTETEVESSRRVQKLLEPNLQLLSQLKTNGIVVQSSSNNLLLV